MGKQVGEERRKIDREGAFNRARWEKGTGINWKVIS